MHHITFSSSNSVDSSNDNINKQMFYCFPQVIYPISILSPFLNLENTNTKKTLFVPALVQIHKNYEQELLFSELPVKAKFNFYNNF
jgi:hypothetical protein